MKMINKKFNVLLSMFILVLVVFTITQTFAWVSLTNSKEGVLNFGDFKVIVSAQDKDTPLVMNQGVFKLNGLSQENYELAVPDIQSNYPDYIPSTDTYSADFNMNITITADIAGYMRIKLLDEWVVTRRYLNFNRVKVEAVFRSGEALFPFELADGWVYDSQSNYCYYTKKIDKGTKKLNIPFIISGIPYEPKKSSAYAETCEVVFGTSIQVVQANRFQEIWGITNIPQITNN